MSRRNVTLLVLAVEMEMQPYFSSTWKVVGRERIFDLIDVGLKLINFELNDETKKQIQEPNQGSYVMSSFGSGLSCSPSCHAINLSRGGHALHLGSLVRQFLCHPLSLLVCLLGILGPGQQRESNEQ